jgi:hypothetical protein
VIGVRRETAPPPALRGLGREVEPDGHAVQPHLHPCTRLLVHPDQRTVSVSWVRSATQVLHSVTVDYDRDAVRVGVRLGTRQAFANRSGYVVLRMIIEHTTLRLREPLRGRRIESLVS